MEDVPLLPVLLNLPDESPAFAYDAASTAATPAWSNKAYNLLAKDGALPLAPESGDELKRRISAYCHSSAVAAAVLMLTLEDGTQLHTSIQIYDSRWIILIGTTTPAVRVVYPYRPF